MNLDNCKIIRFESVASTNQEALSLNAIEPLDEGTVILAWHQYAGRGQGKSKWESEAGKNLTFSLVLRPLFLPPARQFILNQAIALGIREGLARLINDDRFSIKWPNDIYYNAGKVSGMLIENQITGAFLVLSVAGIGINLNQEVFVSDAPNPLSLKNINGADFDSNIALKVCLRAIFKWYEKLKLQQFEQIRHTYLENLLGFGIPMKFGCASGTFSGVISGVDDYGKLIIERGNRHLQAFDFKEVSFLF